MFFDELGVWTIHNCGGFSKTAEKNEISSIMSIEEFFGRKLPYNQELADYNRRTREAKQERDKREKQQQLEHAPAVTSIVEEYVDPEYVKKVQADRLARARLNHPILREDPYKDATTTEAGIIREIIQDVNIFKLLKLEKTPMSAKLLGKLANDTYGQITIHTGALGDEENSSFTFLMKLNLLKQKALTIGDFVSCRLRGYQIPSRKPIWICEHLKSAFE